MNTAPTFTTQRIWELHEAVRRAEDYRAAPWTHPSGCITTAALKRNETMAFRRLSTALKALLPNEQDRLDLMVRMNIESSRRAEAA